MNNTGINNTGAMGNNENNERKLTGFSAEIYEWLEAIAFALAIVVLLFTFVFRIVSVSGSSMEPTLQDMDRVLVRNLFYEPEKYDVVIIVPGVETDENVGELNKALVKRIIGMEGDTIDVDNNGHLTITDKYGQTVTIDELDSQYGKVFDEIIDTGDMDYPITLGENEYFVVGDNRNGSTDSRDHRIGIIDGGNILGKVIFRIFPFDNIGGLD